MKAATLLIILICLTGCLLAIADYLLWHPDYTQGMDAGTIILMVMMVWIGAAAGLIFLLNLAVHGRKK